MISHSHIVHKVAKQIEVCAELARARLVFVGVAMGSLLRCRLRVASAALLQTTGIWFGNGRALAVRVRMVVRVRIAVIVRVTFRTKNTQGLLHNEERCKATENCQPVTRYSHMSTSNETIEA